MTTKQTNTLAWVAQIALAVVFTLAGGFKAFMPPGTLLAKAPDLAGLPLPLVRFIGIAELAAAIGFILPSLTRIAPRLTPIAALCVLPILAGAFVVDYTSRHFGSLFLVVVSGALAAFVVWARSTRVRIEISSSAAA